MYKRTQFPKHQKSTQPLFSQTLTANIIGFALPKTNPNEPKTNPIKANLPRTQKSTQPSFTQSLTTKIANSPPPKRTQTNPTCRGEAYGEAGTNPIFRSSGARKAKTNPIYRGGAMAKTEQTQFVPAKPAAHGQALRQARLAKPDQTQRSEYANKQLPMVEWLMEHNPIRSSLLWSNRGGAGHGGFDCGRCVGNTPPSGALALAKSLTREGIFRIMRIRRRLVKRFFEQERQ
ncbi:MAG TPA: hypothetical protein VMX13_04780 [Sedimentisphaerales bacterium]|nr:hypothetical protein [Sedimentisphaerales bacterium]